jgi:hypothetical protein
VAVQRCGGRAPGADGVSAGDLDHRRRRLLRLKQASQVQADTARVQRELTGSAAAYFLGAGALPRAGDIDCREVTSDSGSPR